jgi:MYXO-CTERM domain-containing protein
MRFVSGGGATFNPGSAPTGPTAWLVWPMPLLPLDDPRIEAQVRGDLALIAPTVRLENDGGAYVLKNTVAAAIALDAIDDPALRAELEALLAETASHATPGTRHFGEVMVAVEEDGARVASQRVASPHLWEGTLFYLTALALEDPDALRAYDRVLPPSRVPPPGGTARPEVFGGGCDCRAGGPAADGAALLLLVATLLRRRRV